MDTELNCASCIYHRSQKFFSLPLVCKERIASEDSRFLWSEKDTPCKLYIESAKHYHERMEENK